MLSGSSRLERDGDPGERLALHLSSWLGHWPPTAPFAVVSSPARELPGWDGTVRPLAGVATPEGTVVSVPAGMLVAALDLLERSGPDGFVAGVGELVAGVPGPLGRGVFRWCREPSDLPDAGEWVERGDPRVPEWLRPFNGAVLVAFDVDGRYAAGVGRKRHDAHGQELAVATEPAHRGRGLGRRLVAQAARRVAADGAVATYLHRADNRASAAVAEAAGFPDVGWQVLGLPTAS
jgi:GNAT superfamily N-acetyltransferase